MKTVIKDLKIGVLMGGVSAEREISLKTGNAVANSLVSMGYNVKKFDLDKNFFEDAKNIDICFNALHGTLGEDGKIQGVLELLNIPYTGSGVEASAIAMDKIKSKIIFKYYGLAVPDFFSVKKGEKAELLNKKINNLRLPYFIKPNAQGSSVGASIAYSKSELYLALEDAFKYDDEVIAEEYIVGREIQFAVFSGKPLGCVEIKPNDSFYSYSAKYTKGKTEYILNPDLTEEEYKACENASVLAHTSLDCKGITRTDIILSDSGKAYVLEINTLPGLTEFSLVPMIAQKKGIDFNSLIENIIEDAISCE
ncbi:MAG: D-alanine--D-alanine ligase [Candidatus Acididesulfobacter diazotrophicus]|jgi:D-alanine-D-alanine ligase|uniref:D-alanine--D-alanine ligase n=1 Tax=Candidatus Acididesulfobacter diazotrophicus TaxID=2597226 RepID=A0A519BNC9_9DELT|nr:MAG: D-alanine--D-alanine ligase [Candidatus Acididesulfobacter diazotrophicus]